MTSERPDSTFTDDDLWELLLTALARMGAVVEVQPGVVRVEPPGDEPGDVHPVEIRMTPRQLRETVTSLSADGEEALEIADPVAAGWGLFTIHLEEHLETMRADEGYLLWRQGALHPSVALEWPPRRGNLTPLSTPEPGDRWEWRAHP